MIWGASGFCHSLTLGWVILPSLSGAVRWIFPPCIALCSLQEWSFPTVGPAFMPDSAPLSWAGTPRRIPRTGFAPALAIVRHLKEADFVALYIRYRVARILRCVPARTISYFLAGLHSLLALPKGNAD